MTMKTCELYVFKRQSKIKRICCSAVSDIETKLGILIGCLDICMGISLYTRANAKQYFLLNASFFSKLVNANKLFVSIKVI